MPQLTREQSRRIDRIATEQLGIPGVVLMENAGRNATAVILDCLSSHPPTRAQQTGPVVILCGGGNNGGDGYVIARHLYNAGVGVWIGSAKDTGELTGDAAINQRICANMGLPIHPLRTIEQLDAAAPVWSRAPLVVDALLGTGFCGNVRAPLDAIINRCNALAGPRIIAIDLPSGLDADTGQPTNATIRAAVTVTFVAEKIGFAQPTAQPYLGEVVVCGIGTPPSLIDQVIGQRDA